MEDTKDRDSNRGKKKKKLPRGEKTEKNIRKCILTYNCMIIWTQTCQLLASPRGVQGLVRFGTSTHLMSHWEVTRAMGNSPRAEHKREMEGGRRVCPRVHKHVGAWRKRTTKQGGQERGVRGTGTPGGWWRNSSVSLRGGYCFQGLPDPSFWFERHCLPRGCHTRSQAGLQWHVRVGILSSREKWCVAGEKPDPTKGKVKCHSVIQLMAETGNSSWPREWLTHASFLYLHFITCYAKW